MVSNPFWQFEILRSLLCVFQIFMYVYAFFSVKVLCVFRAWILVFCFMFVSELMFWLGYDVQRMRVVVI